MGLKGKDTTTTRSQLVIVGTVFAVATLAALGYFAFLNMGSPEETISNTSYSDAYDDSSSSVVFNHNKAPATPESNEDPRSTVDISPIPEGAVTETFLMGDENDFSKPAEVPLQGPWMRTIKALRPAGNIAVHAIHMYAVEEDFSVIPQHIMYNHHSQIKVDGKEWAGFAAESLYSFHSYPAPHARILKSGQRVEITTMYIPLKSLALTTPTRAYINLTMVYTKLDNEDGTLNQEKLKQWIPINMQLLGIYTTQNGDFVVPGDGGKGSAYCKTHPIKWYIADAKLVKIMGHLHTRAINLTLSDGETNEEIATVTATFSPDGFVSRVGGRNVNVTLVKGREYIIRACYSNERYLKEAMGVFQAFYYLAPPTTQPV